MKFIAITGGIGSGKSYVCGLLNERGVRVYDCDAAARRLMNEDLKLQRSLQHLVGEQVFLHGELQKNVLGVYSVNFFPYFQNSAMSNLCSIGSPFDNLRWVSQKWCAP